MVCAEGLVTNNNAFEAYVVEVVDNKERTVGYFEMQMFNPDKPTLVKKVYA